MKKLWLIFAQALTVSLGVWFIIGCFKPEWGMPLQQSKLIPPAAHPTLPLIDGPRLPATASYRDAVRKAIPSVVNIFTSKRVAAKRSPLLEDPIFRRFFGDGSDTEPQDESSLGSGVIVSADGYIVTNNHVVEAADEIKVALADGRKLTATVRGTDPDTDLAVLKIDATNLTPINIAKDNSAHVGDVVLAIGQPFGFGQTVTMGIVSALGRSHLGINTFENFIQSDAAINPGNSGGALVDTNGVLIGINSAIYSQSGGSQGIGFAIPVTTVKNVMLQIIKSGAVTRGWLGAEVQDITPDLAASFKLANTEGVLITGVVKNGPADQAGIRTGDVLITIQAKALTDTNTLLDVIASIPPDTQTEVQLLRDRAPASVKITIGKRPRPNHE